MKHIKHKFLQYEIGDHSVRDVFNNAVPNEKIQPDSDEHVIIMKFDNEDYFTHAFTYKKDGKTIVIPEPDLVVCLFELSRNYCIQIKDLKSSLLAQCDDLNSIRLNAFKFYASATLAVTTLFNCLEAFLNRLIPPNFTYTGTIAFRKNLAWNKESIERYMGIENKIKDVIPQIKGVSFHVIHGSKFDTLKKLKEIRDMMTHIKAAFATSKPIYSNLYLNALDFEYLSALQAVRDYINFHHPDLIETCDCGQDY